jgi:hypothetical protein
MATIDVRVTTAPAQPALLYKFSPLSYWNLPKTISPCPEPTTGVMTTKPRWSRALCPNAKGREAAITVESRSTAKNRGIRRLYARALSVNDAADRLRAVERLLRHDAGTPEALKIQCGNVTAVNNHQSTIDFHISSELLDVGDIHRFG